MPIVPITPEPGVWRNGTRYQSRGRYFDTNLVRWHDGALRPIGGWAAYATADGSPIEPLFDDASLEAVRDSIAWRTVEGSALFAWGSNLKLYLQVVSGQVEDITPDSLPQGALAASQNDGYGSGTYSFGSYGVVSRIVSYEINSLAGRWQFDNWGENLFALPDWVGTIYEYVPSGGPAVPLPNAPTDIDAFVVTNNRIVMTFGSDNDRRIVRWSDQDDPTNWDISEISNQAGEIVLPGGGNIIGGYSIRNSVLILTETDAYVAQYVGPPFVYSFTKVAENCAPLHRNSVCSTDTFVVWWGARNFWIFDGAQVNRLPCDVMDFLINDIDLLQASTMFTWEHSQFTEIWWHYNSIDVDESSPNKYVTYDWYERHWALGSLDRTTAIPSGVLDNPLMVGVDGVVNTHEQKDVGFPEGYKAFAETGPLEVQNGDSLVGLRRVFLDTEDFGDVSVSFTSRQHPTGPTAFFGPYEYNNPVPVKVSGREVQMKIEGVSSNWEVGIIRADLVTFGITAR